MSDRNINEKFRKPRRAKGTPFFVQRNFYAAGIIAFSGLSWYLFELWPKARKLKRAQLEDGILDGNPVIRERFLQAQVSLSAPGNDHLVNELRKRREMKEDAAYTKQQESQPVPCVSSESISKYFVQTPKLERNVSKLSIPLVDNTNEIKSIDLDSSGSDFRSPEKVFKLPKTNVKKKKKTRQTNLKHFVNKNVPKLDVNLDHLQMAIALSESSYNAENSNGEKQVDEKIHNFKAVLEKYGLNCGTKQENRKVIKPEVNKKSKFRFVKPILYIRSEEERKKLITQKISLVLDQTTCKKSLDFSSIIFSEKLQLLKNSTLLPLNNIQSKNYYIKNWKFTNIFPICGNLLKDWKTISGRDKSPERLTTAYRSDSPDIFDIDNKNISLELARNQTMEYNFVEDSICIQNLNNTFFNDSEDQVEEISQSNDLLSTCKIEEELESYGLNVALIKPIYYKDLLNCLDNAVEHLEDDYLDYDLELEKIEILNSLPYLENEVLIFERKPPKAISCRVPLQIAWNNFTSACPSIKRKILLHEPLKLTELHEMLKEQGYKFHIEDLLQFLDEKCITVRKDF